MLRVCLFLLTTFLLIGCEGRKDERPGGFTLPEDRPDHFLRFLNHQAPLADGDYQLIVLPQTQEAGTATGTYTLGSTETSLSFTWTAEVDVDFSTTGISSHSFTFVEGQDLSASVSCSVPCTLIIFKNNLSHYLVQSVENVITLDLSANALDSLQYANAYYESVDPINERTTLANWKMKNGFDAGYDAHVIFRDSKDLGYGRDMYAKFHDDGGIALFVNNFVISAGKGNPASYGPTNLLAAVDQNFDFHAGTNAIEFSPIQNADGTVEDGALYVMKFFTFTPADEDGVQHRLNAADLDGRGVKHMPTTCLVCHGARILPLNSDGTFNPLSLASAKLNQLEVDSFEFMEYGNYTEANQQASIKLINQKVHDSFSVIESRSLADNAGVWDGDFAREIAAGRYQASDTPELFDSTTYVETHIPEGWTQTDFRPEGVETLYKRVVEPHCVSCHSLRGFEAGNDADLDVATINGQVTQAGSSINFSTYEKFIGYSDIIIDYVYRRGVMPLSLRNYETFWRFPEDAPTLLASFLPGFDVLNDNNEVEEPGKPYARFGRDRISNSPVLLNGNGSYFANEYAWSIISTPTDAVASLSSSNDKMTTLTADTDGEYEIKLKVSNSRGTHETTVTITVDGQRTPGSDLTFVDDVMPLLQTTLYELRTCQSCHFSGSTIESIPVYYDSSNESLYRDVRHRVNFADADNSILIRKPTRLQHGGGLRIDLQTQSGKNVYSTLMDWIIHGAPCGSDETVCQ